MKKITRNLSIVLTLLATLSSANITAKELKIGVVDVQGIAAQLPQMANVQQGVRDEFKIEIEEITKLQADAKYNYDKLQREGATLSTEAADELKKTILAQQSELENKAKPLQQRMQTRGAEKQSEILTLIQSAINEEAKSGGYSLILYKASIAYSDDNAKDTKSSDSIIHKK